MNRDNCDSEYERQRLLRIEENKAMLAKLFPEGTSLIPRRSLTPNPYKAKPRRKSSVAALGVVRRNPSRRARSYKTCDDVDEDEGEEVVYTPDTLIVKWRGPLTERLFHKNDSSTASDGYSSGSGSSEDSFVGVRRRKTPARSRAPFRPAAEILEEDLILVAERVADKRYDSVNGTSCHQCRQKTDDLKTFCRSDTCIGIRGQFCGPCLRNRYGEDAKKALMDPNWICPPCRDICNCSFCMKKRGMRCTGILIHLAREKGFEDVKTFLGD